VAVVRTLYGGIGDKTSATTLAVPTSALIPAGTLLVMSVCCDNATATAPTISSITNVGGGTWTNRAGSTTQSGATSTAGSGVFVYCQTLLTTSSVASGTVVTVTFSVATVAKVLWLIGLTETSNTLRNTVVSAASAAGTPSVVTAGTALVAGDIVIGVVGAESIGAPTGDADTLNGTWEGTPVGFSTNGGATNTNVTVGIQHKVVTATGAQTYNPTLFAAGNDSVAIVFALQPAAPAVGAPTARTISGSVASATSVALTWADDTAAAPDPTYLIEKSTTSASTGFTTHASGQTGQTGYTVTGLTTGTPYWFRVTGSNASGSSSSNTVGPLATSPALAFAGWGMRM
jgi:hypothetical protein